VIPIYSPQDAIAENPHLAAERATRTCLSEIDSYPALPWCLEELPGTEWIAVFTFRIITIGTPDKAYDRYDRLGTWHGKRFIVAHWVRWDVLSCHAQQCWQQAHVAALHQRITTLQADLRELDAKPSAKKEHKQQRRGIAHQLDRARGELNRLSELPLALVGEGVL
jgi:hypothetical protein